MARSFWYGCFGEAALLGIAAILASFFHRPLLEPIFWRAADVGWGILATIPMLLGFWWTLKSSSGIAARLRKDIGLVFRPFVANWSLGQIAVISLIAGVCEEVLFRGVLQSGLSAITDTGTGLLVSSIMFGFAHPISMAYIVAGGVLGIFLGALFLLTDNLLAPIVAHALYDFCVLAWLLRRHSDTC